jgi:hypothetical protein
MPDTTVNSEWNRITQYVKLSILMSLFETFRIKWKAREEASRKGVGHVLPLPRQKKPWGADRALFDQIQIQILSSTSSSPSRTVTTTTPMSALRILVPVKRVIDYAVRLPFSNLVQLIALPIPDLKPLFHSSPLPARKSEGSQPRTRWSDAAWSRGWVAGGSERDEGGIEREGVQEGMLTGRKRSNPASTRRRPQSRPRA